MKMKIRMRNVATRIGSAVRIIWRKHSSDILFGLGIGGGLIGAGMACSATRNRLPDILEKSSERTSDIKKQANKLVPTKNVEKSTAIQIGRNYAKTGFEMVRAYAPSVSVGAMSVTLLFLSHGILKKRNVALTAAYAALSNGYSMYRQRVANAYGEDVEKRLYSGEDISVMVPEKNAPEVYSKKEVDRIESAYARVFDSSNPYWSDMFIRNQTFVSMREGYLNDRAQTQHFLFLNDVYRDLGFPLTKAGQEVGWVIDDDPNVPHDNSVTFTTRIIKVENEPGKIEDAIVIDFNVDGPILDRVKLASI